MGILREGEPLHPAEKKEHTKMMIIVQLILYCLLFTGMVKLAVRDGAVDGLYFYPKPVQERAIEIGLTTQDAVHRWHDGIVIDKVWVGHSKFWVLSGTEDIPFIQTWKQVLKKLCILTLIWVAGAAISAGLVVLIF